MKIEFTRTPVVVLFFLLFATSGLRTASTQESGANAPVDFNRHVKPILSDRCFLCHGPDKARRKSDLRLDTEEGSRAVIEAGKPQDSELITRIFADDDDRMPPADSKLSLTDSEKQTLKRWIAEGARWEQHWAFVAPRKPVPAKTRDAQWATNEIDQFVLVGLEEAHLSPAPPTTREKLLRRATFDLTGLPPTLDELDAFVADQSADAYEKIVDRLLDSPRYGERMTSDWLDVARYSDTYGYQVDRDRFVWPWRDWVVRSFNQNLPYDQFITEQLAGDLLPNATDDQILATTFNRLHPQKVEGGSVEEEFRVEYVADRSQTVGMAFMGLTVECARCHDHKYDPLSQKEYYQLFAYFNNIDESGLYSYFDAGAVPTPTLLLTDENKKAERAKLSKRLQAAEERARSFFIAQRPEPEEAAVGETESPFKLWLRQTDQRRKLAEAETGGLVLAVDFATTSNSNNELVDGPHGLKALKLTGDDEVHIDAGSFRRDQPFTIATRIKIPDDHQLSRRAVILHRSRAWTDSASRGFQWLIEDGRLSASLIHFWPGDAISVRTKKRVSTEQWQHVAMVYDGSSQADGIQIFIDGQPVEIEIVRDNLQKTINGSGIDRLVIGARFRDIGFKNGQLADLRVFNRQLSRLEVSRLVDEQYFNTVLAQSADRLDDPGERLLQEYYLLNVDQDYAALQQEVLANRKTLNEFTDRLQEIMVMREMPEPRPTFVLHRGAYDSPGDPVESATPAVFPGLPEGSPNNRLGLANWLTAPSHPLTARVAVNHYWQLCFGEGLVRTPEDFGSQGQPPTHPELLDWLAVDFQEHGWDLKRLLKQMVMSSTYRQSTAASAELSKFDPDNRWLARAPTYRLPAEMIRDNVLFAGGLLVEKIGGPPVRPYELAKSFQPSNPDTGEGLYRRSLYTYWKRTGPAPVMLTLDAAKRDVCQLKRERTSSPLAALVQLNNPQTVEASRKLAERLISKHGDDRSKISVELFRTLTSRFPSEREQSIIDALWTSQLEYFQNNEAASRAYLDVGQSKSETSEPARLAAWASVVNTLFSFDECVMKR